MKDRIITVPSGSPQILDLDCKSYVFCDSVCWFHPLNEGPLLDYISFVYPRCLPAGKYKVFPPKAMSWYSAGVFSTRSVTLFITEATCDRLPLRPIPIISGSTTIPASSRQEFEMPIYCGHLVGFYVGAWEAGTYTSIYSNTSTMGNAVVSYIPNLAVSISIEITAYTTINLNLETSDSVEYRIMPRYQTAQWLTIRPNVTSGALTAIQFSGQNYKTHIKFTDTQAGAQYAYSVYFRIQNADTNPVTVIPTVTLTPLE